MESKSKKLRAGYTTGACAAAAAKAAALLLTRNDEKIAAVEIPFPDGSRASFKMHDSGCRMQDHVAYASIIKDAGDDPDVTNGAEIVATVQSSEFGAQSSGDREITIRGGKGVGVVTKPGLAVAVGEAAINPVPLRMIREAVQEALAAADSNRVPDQQSTINNRRLIITISVPAGEELAKKTLNHRLGIVGGISILGTTGIVRPLSAEAWTATIKASMDVATAAGLTEIVLSSGRTSEKAYMKKYHFPEEAYAMMGDYLEFSLGEAKRHGFKRIHLCAQWAKMLKIAMGTPQTHVRHGALEAKAAADFLSKLGIDIPRNIVFNTSREIYDYLFSDQSTINNRQSTMSKVCLAAKRYAEKLAGGIPVSVHPVSYEGDILADSE